MISSSFDETLKPKTALAEGIAQKIQKKYNLHVPIPIQSFVTDLLGYQIIEDILADWISAQADHSRKIILLNQSHHRHRQRFSIAHELGHFYMKHLEELQGSLNAPLKEIQKRQESEADIFAGAFLMPKDQLKKLFSQGLSIPELIAKFDVSKNALWIRLKTLRLV